MPSKAELKRQQELAKNLAELRKKHLAQDWDGEAARAYFLREQKNVSDKPNKSEPLPVQKFDRQFWTARNAVIRAIFQESVFKDKFIERLNKLLSENKIIEPIHEEVSTTADKEENLKWQMETIKEILTKIEKNEYSFQKPESN